MQINAYKHHKQSRNTIKHKTKKMFYNIFALFTEERDEKNFIRHGNGYYTQISLENLPVEISCDQQKLWV